MSRHAKKSVDLLIKPLRKFFKKEKEVLFCYLFGSLVYGDFISKSDIDLAVCLDERKCQDFFEKKLELISKISTLLKKEVDIIILNIAPPFFRYVVIKEGKLIFEADKERRIDFELRTFNEYFDFKPILEKYHQRILAS